jgi:hypothetical protein
VNVRTVYNLCIYFTFNVYLNSASLFARYLGEAVLFGKASRVKLSLLYFNSLHCKQLTVCTLIRSNDWMTVSEDLDSM